MDEIKLLVGSLPEVYQNIYGHAEYDEDSSRNCNERKDCIIDIIKTYKDYTGKNNLKILDIGCAQGYYCFSAAEVGCRAVGIDMCKENIDLCNALQKENKLDCTFYTDKISVETVEKIEDGEFDVIMIFSVIHHIANEMGFEYARRIFEILAQKTGLVLTELALKEEPLYWNKNLPERYDDWFENISFYDEQRFFNTHLSDYSRPLLLFSNEYCYLKNRFYKIEEYSKSAYKGKPESPEKRYFLCDDKTVLLKRYSRWTKELFKDELRSEVEFLNNMEVSFAPQLIDYDSSYGRVIESIKIEFGTLLRDLIKNGSVINYEKVFDDVINNCVELESNGFYHSDLRVWNVCISDNKAYLIDFGALQKNNHDELLSFMCGNDTTDISVYDSFCLMLYDTLNGNYYDTIEDYEWYMPTFFFDFRTLPMNFRNFFVAFMSEDEGKMSFLKIRELYDQYVINRGTFRISESGKVNMTYKQLRMLNFQKEDRKDSELKHRELTASIDELRSRIDEINNFKFMRGYRKLRKLWLKITNRGTNS